MIRVILTFIGGYLLGSVPFAYLVVKKAAEIDIREAGSGNAGGFNAYYVTKSRWTGLFVGVLDCLKGAVAVYGAGLATPNAFLIQVVALFGAIAGHNYSVWLGFKGGRGLSTCAGGMFFLGFSYTLVWCAVWLVARLFKRDILVSNLIAIYLAPPILLLVPWDWVRRLIVVEVDEWTFLFFSSILSLVLLVSHQDVVRDLWKATTGEPKVTQSLHS